MQMLTVTANATLLVPDGYAVDPQHPAVLRAPNGETYKFWVSVELYTDCDGEEALLDLSTEQLALREMYLEHEASILTLAPEPEPRADGEETAAQVYARTGDERLRTVM